MHACPTWRRIGFTRRLAFIRASRGTRVFDPSPAQRSLAYAFPSFPAQLDKTATLGGKQQPEFTPQGPIREMSDVAALSLLDAERGVVLRQAGPAGHPRPRRTPPHPRALADDQGTRDRDRPARRPDCSAAARRTRSRAADRGQARAPPASLPSPSAPARPTANAPTAAATARSTRPSTAIAVTRLPCRPETQDYIARKRAEGKSTKEAIRCLKRHLARRLWHLLLHAAPRGQGHPHSSTS